MPVGERVGDDTSDPGGSGEQQATVPASPASLTPHSPSWPTPWTMPALEEFGRVKLSKSFFMRDFLFSEVASLHGLLNAPDDPDLAIAAGTRLCEELLEPLQDKFGRIAIRSAYRSPEVNDIGRRLYGRCARNELNYAKHIWDRRDAKGYMGATACIVVPSFIERFRSPGDWQKLAWWIHDHLNYSKLCFYPTLWAFNISWHEKPARTIYSYAEPKGLLTARHRSGNEEGYPKHYTRLMEILSS